MICVVCKRSEAPHGLCDACTDLALGAERGEVAAVLLRRAGSDHGRTCTFCGSAGAVDGSCASCYLEIMVTIDALRARYAEPAVCPHCDHGYARRLCTCAD